MACKEVGFVAPALRTVKCRSARKLYAKDKVQKVRDCAKRLEWPVYFQIEMLLSNGILTPEEILRLNQPLWDARLLHDDEGIINALKTLASIEERQRYQLYRENREEDIVKLMESILADRLTAAVQTFWTKRKKVEPNRVLLHQITFTPTARFLEGPTWEQSNRVLRRFEDHLDHFIRVTFAEVGLSTLIRQLADLMSRRTTSSTGPIETSTVGRFCTNALARSSSAALIWADSISTFSLIPIPP